MDCHVEEHERIPENDLFLNIEDFFWSIPEVFELHFCTIPYQFDIGVVHALHDLILFSMLEYNCDSNFKEEIFEEDNQ